MKRADVREVSDLVDHLRRSAIDRHHPLRRAYRAHGRPAAPPARLVAGRCPGALPAPFTDLLFRAHGFTACTSIPTPCSSAVCSASRPAAARRIAAIAASPSDHDTGLEASKLMEVERRARRGAQGARSGRDPLLHGRGLAQPKDRDMEPSSPWSRAVKALGMETCMTLGMLDAERRRSALAQAGLDYYNHNIDTSERYYGKIITTRSYGDRLDTLEACARVGHEGLLRRHRRHGREGERPRRDAGDARESAGASPESVPINMLIPIPGTPLAAADAARPDRFRAHHRARPHPHAGVHGASVGGPHRHER